MVFLDNKTSLNGLNSNSNKMQRSMRSDKLLEVVITRITNLLPMMPILVKVQRLPPLSWKSLDLSFWMF